MDDAVGLQSVQKALSMAQQHGYRILELRAQNAISGLYWALGDLHSAWIADADGLRAYWSGDCPSIRGYNLLANLDDIVQQQQQWFLAATILNESIPMIVDHPDQGMRAFEQARLGNALLRIGDLEGSERSFRETQHLFEAVPAGNRRDVLRAEAEIGLARAQAERGDAQAAVNRLDAIRPVISKTSEDDLHLDYFQASGVSRMHQGHFAQAAGDLQEALRLAEKGLRLVTSEGDRRKWSRRNESLYRAMVELELHLNSNLSLSYWEWYKSASIRGLDRTHSIAANGSAPLEVTPSLAFDSASLDKESAIVSYVLFPKGISVWVWDRTGIRQRWIELPKSALVSLAQRFIEHCSNPDSRLDEAREDGAEVYRRIILPIEPWIAGHHRLIVEPDGILNLVPLEALVDARGDYLSDRFAVTVSAGTEYLAHSRHWTGISHTSVALVIGDPVVQGWNALPDAEQEARAVAASFIHPRLLLRSSASDAEIVREISNADIFHFSGHSSSSVQSAGLVMGNSGLFGTHKLGNQGPQRTQLVVLSACASARGTTGFFNDEDSLVEHLAAAGTPEIVASRWMVDSRQTAKLMQGFYGRLLSGDDVSDSLRMATLNLRRDPHFAHPYFWAGFTVFGRG